MDETRPLFIIRKYRSVMRAAVVIELVAYLVSLTDALIAGRFISSNALTAIGLMAPLQFTIVFLSAAINSGTLLGYTRAVGAFDRQRACEVFSEGTITAAGTGLLFAGLMVALRKPFFALLYAEPEILRYLRDYYSVIVLYYLFRPLNVVLDSIVMNDGGERLSSAANVLQTVGNVLLSYLFMKLWGVRGIAFATALSQLAATAIISTWFFRGKSFLRLVRYFKAGEVFALCRSGLSRASYFVMTAGMIAVLNALVLRMFDNDTAAVLILVEKLLDAAEIFMGLSLALQPFVAVLRFEGNTKAERILVREAILRIAAAGLLLSALFLAGAPLLVRVFGLVLPSLQAAGIPGIRIACSTLAIKALLTFFFIYYFLIGEKKPTYFLCILGEFAIPVGLTAAFAAISGKPEGVWIGLAVSPVLSLAAGLLFVRLRYGRERFPLLLAPNDGRIHIYVFPLRPENTSAMAETAGAVLKKAGYPAKARGVFELLTEDILGLICERNRDSGKELSLEYTLILEEDGARMILRDDGKALELTDTDAEPGSFRQYIVSMALAIPKQRRHISAAEYNRNEFFFEKQRGGAKP